MAHPRITRPTTRVLAAVFVATVTALAAVNCGGTDHPAGNPADASTEPANQVDSGTSTGGTTDGGSRDAGSGEASIPVDGSTDEGSGLPADLLAFCKKTSATTCQLRKACNYTNAANDATCLADEFSQCVQGVVQVLPAISAGRVVYDASKVDACIADAGKVFCDNNNLNAPSCSAVFTGTVPVGSPCYQPYAYAILGMGTLNECANAFCSSNIDTCPGTCVASVDDGKPCDDAVARCKQGSYCESGTCHPYVGAGTSCDDVLVRCETPLGCLPGNPFDGGLSCKERKGEGGSCIYDAECYRFNCLTGTCRAGHEGETCAAYGKCDAGLKCDGTCKKPLAEGKRCDPQYSACADGLTCAQTGSNDAGQVVGVCADPHQYPTAGQTCAYQAYCATGLWCDPSDTCRGPGKAGEPCTGGDPTTCVAGLVCDGGSKKCQVAGKAGDACDPDWSVTCAAGFNCAEDGKCRAVRKPGAPCSVDAECPKNYDCHTTCVVGKLPGTPCVDTDRCIGGRCDPDKHTCNGDCIDPG